MMLSWPKRLRRLRPSGTQQLGLTDNEDVESCVVGARDHDEIILPLLRMIKGQLLPPGERHCHRLIGSLARIRDLGFVCLGRRSTFHLTRETPAVAPDGDRDVSSTDGGDGEGVLSYRVPQETWVVSCLSSVVTCRGCSR